MRCELFFITGIMGIAVISGIIGALSSKPERVKKEEEEKAPSPGPSAA